MDGGQTLILVSFGDELVHGDSAPRLIAKENSLNFVDKSSAGPTSNLQIYKDVIRSVIDINDVENYIFLIGWTRKDRISYRSKNTDIVFQKDKVDHEIKIYNKLNKFNRYLFEPILVNQQLLALVHATQQVLESKGIRYYMYNTDDKIDYNNKTMISLKSINNKLYHNALSYDSSMKGYLRKQKLDITHQDVWAKFLAQKMRAAGVIEK